MLAVAAIASVALWIAVAAQAATVVVSPITPSGWDTLQLGSATAGLEEGPATPPLGSGSAQLTVGGDTGGDRSEFSTSSLVGVALSAITRLDYSNFVSQNQAGSCVTPYLAFDVDVDGDGTFEPGTPDDTISFEPCYQTGDYITEPPGQTIPDQCANAGNDPVSPCFGDGVWNHWDARIGGWWSVFYGGSGGPPLTTLPQYLQTLAGMGFGSPEVYSLRVRVSAGPPTWNNFEGNFDALTVGVSGADTTYDFETTSDPVEGSTHNVFPVSGTVLVKEPGGTSARVATTSGAGFTQLTDAEQIRDGSVIDADKGKLKLVSAYNGRLQSARLFTGTFRVQQARSRRPIVVLSLLGALSRCRRAGGANSSASGILEHRTGRRHRHLWASGSGNYRTSGNSGAATVSGTKWKTVDQCRGRTLFLVRSGVIKIDDFGIPGRVNKILRAGQRYIAQR